MAGRCRHSRNLSRVGFGHVGEHETINWGVPVRHPLLPAGITQARKFRANGSTLDAEALSLPVEKDIRRLRLASGNRFQDRPGRNQRSFDV